MSIEPAPPPRRREIEQLETALNIQSPAEIIDTRNKSKRRKSRFSLTSASNKQTLTDRIRSEMPNVKHAKNLVHGSYINDLLTHDEQAFFIERCRQILTDHPDLDATFDMVSIQDAIMSEIRLSRLYQYELASFLDAKATGFAVAPDFLSRHSQTIHSQMSKAAADSHLSRSARTDGAGNSNLRISIAAVASSINYDKAQQMRVQYAEEEEKMAEYLRIRQDKLQQIDLSKDGSGEHDVLEILEQTQNESAMVRMSNDVGDTFNPEEQK